MAADADASRETRAGIEASPRSVRAGGRRPGLRSVHEPGHRARGRADDPGGAPGREPRDGPAQVPRTVLGGRHAATRPHPDERGRDPQAPRQRREVVVPPQPRGRGGRALRLDGRRPRSRVRDGSRRQHGRPPGGLRRRLRGEPGCCGRPPARRPGRPRMARRASAVTAVGLRPHDRGAGPAQRAP